MVGYDVAGSPEVGAVVVMVVVVIFRCVCCRCFWRGRRRVGEWCWWIVRDGVWLRGDREIVPGVFRWVYRQDGGVVGGGDCSL